MIKHCQLFLKDRKNAISVDLSLYDSSVDFGSGLYRFTCIHCWKL